MVLKILMKNPLLVIGILMMALFIYDLRNRGILNKRENIKATSCRSALVMLNKRVPQNWSIKCRDNNMEVKINFTPKQSLKNINLIRRVYYGELANDLIFVAKNSLNESLERVFMITMVIDGPSLKISALTEGRFISKFATLSNPRFIKDHLQATVQVKEFPKN